MATIHDLANPDILKLSWSEAFELVKQRRANRRVSKAKKTAKTRVSAAKSRQTPKQLAAKLTNAQLAQLIQEMEARL